jgi:hypothetical protein
LATVDSREVFCRVAITSGSVYTFVEIKACDSSVQGVEKVKLQASVKPVYEKSVGLEFDMQIDSLWDDYI